MVRGEVDRVWYLVMSGLSQKKRRFRAQCVATFRVETKK